MNRPVLTASAAGAVLLVAACTLVDDRTVLSNVACVDGVCSCIDGFADCSDDNATDCETDITRSDEHCGVCGVTCIDASCEDGVCVCAPGKADCNGDPTDGCEVDLRESAMHCGACGHGCEGASCAEGQCEAVAVLEQRSSARYLDKMGDELVWVEQSDIMAMRPGEPPRVFATGDAVASELRAIGTGVVMWISGRNVQLSDGTSTQTMFTHPDPFCEGVNGSCLDTLRAANGRAVVADVRGGLWRFSLRGAMLPEKVTSSVNWDGGAVEIDESSVYFGSGSDIWRLPFDEPTSNAARMVTTEQGIPIWLRAFDDALYIQTYSESDRSYLLRTALAGGPVEELPHDREDYIVTVHESGFYATDDSRVLHYPLSGNKRVLADGQHDILYRIVVDDQYAHWFAYETTTAQNLRLMRVVR